MIRLKFAFRSRISSRGLSSKTVQKRLSAKNVFLGNLVIMFYKKNFDLRLKNLLR
jgi:hypothetical protein